VKKIYFFIILTLYFSLIVCGVVEKLANRDPIITSVTANPSQIKIQDTTILKVEAEDPDGDILAYRWESPSGGRFVSYTGEEVQWIAPTSSGRFKIEVQVTDENGGKANGDVEVEVKGDESPIVTIIQPVENEIIPGLGFYTIKVDVYFMWPIERVDFFIDGDSLFSDRTEPYEWLHWDVTTLSGPKVVMVKAYPTDRLFKYGVDSVQVTIEGAVPIPK